MMSEKEIMEMQRLIDEGIVLAQQRLVARARYDRESLVFSQGGKIVETIPEGPTESVREKAGDPLLRYRYK